MTAVGRCLITVFLHRTARPGGSDESSFFFQAKSRFLMVRYRVRFFYDPLLKYKILAAVKFFFWGLYSNLLDHLVVFGRKTDERTFLCSLGLVEFCWACETDCCIRR